MKHIKKVKNSEFESTEKQGAEKPVALKVIKANDSQQGPKECLPLGT